MNFRMSGFNKVIVALFVLGFSVEQTEAIFRRRSNRDDECPRCLRVLSVVHTFLDDGSCVDRCAVNGNFALQWGWKCGRCPPPQPSAAPSEPPSLIPSDMPSDMPSNVPSQVPSLAPTVTHSASPSDVPSAVPTPMPTTVASTMFNTEVDLDQIPELARTAFYDAVKRWDEVIVGDLPDVDTSLEIQNNTVCGDRVPDVIDDLFVCPRIEKMDGPGGLIGIVDVEWRRADSGLPVVGRMDFDLEDVPNLIFAGKFADVVLHGLGQLYGFSGEHWESANITSDCVYDSTLQASSEWQTLTGCPASVPIPVDEETCSNWDDTCLPNELLNNVVGGSLSRMTIAALQDVGYEVDFAAADPYTVKNVNTDCLDELCPAPSGRRRELEMPNSRGIRGLQENEQALRIKESNRNIIKRLREFLKELAKEVRDAARSNAEETRVFAYYQNDITGQIYMTVV